MSLGGLGSMFYKAEALGSIASDTRQRPWSPATHHVPVSFFKYTLLAIGGSDYHPFQDGAATSPSTLGTVKSIYAPGALYRMAGNS